MSIHILHFQRTHSIEQTTPLFSDPSSLLEFARIQKLPFSPSIMGFKVCLQSPTCKTHVPPPNDSRRERSHREEEMDFEGSSLAIIQKFAFVLPNVGGQKIREDVFARTDYLMKVLDYTTLQNIFRECYSHRNGAFLFELFLLFSLLPSSPSVLLFPFFFFFSSSSSFRTSWQSGLYTCVQSNAVAARCSKGTTGFPTSVAYKSEQASSKQCPWAPCFWRGRMEEGENLLVQR